MLTVELERLEATFATAGQSSPEDLDLYQRTAGGLRRLLETVGIQRRPRDVTPSLADYLAAWFGLSQFLKTEIGATFSHDECRA